MTSESGNGRNVTLLKRQGHTLPRVDDTSAPFLQALTSAMGVPRDVLASDEQIASVATDLPKLLRQIAPELRNEELVRMCVAVYSGLFDSAVNYVWNAAVLALREAVRLFGLTIIPQITDDDDFDESKLINLKDSELIRLCLSLNLISEHSFFMLNQCRDIRNNFSSAHPPKGDLDEYEVLSFLNRVSKYALAMESNPQGVDVQELITSIESREFASEQRHVWCERIKGTYEAQRATIFGMLHGMYCDPGKAEHIRVNALGICKELHGEYFTPAVKSLLINRHQDYLAKGDSKRNAKSRELFESLGLTSLLSKPELHSMISSACSNLFDVHNSLNNFYNEPPFAQRLLDITENQEVPDSAKSEYVETVITCSVGNQYGTSYAADEYYLRMVQSFSGKEIQLMLKIPNESSEIAKRIESHARCKDKFVNLVRALDESSIPPSSQNRYKYWMDQRNPF